MSKGYSRVRVENLKVSDCEFFQNVTSHEEVLEYVKTHPYLTVKIYRIWGRASRTRYLQGLYMKCKHRRVKA